MTPIETQVAKIQIGNSKQTSTFVSVVAEKSPHPDCELFLVQELPLLNPAAASDCERITESVISTLRRSYRRGLNENTFEAALGEINEELGKLTTLGQTHWVGKLAAIIAVKHGMRLHIATTGKTAALLLRDGEFIDIAETAKPEHPLKTFEHYATGKLKLGDVCIFSTTALFNHVSLDRLKNILTSYTINLAGEQVVNLLEDNAGPDVAFGTLFMQLSDTGADQDGDNLNLAEFLPKQISVKDKIKTMATSAAKLFHPKRVSALTLKAKSFVEKGPSLNIREVIDQTKKLPVGRGAERIKNAFRPSTIVGLSKPKKFFLISAAILLVVIIANVGIARHYKASRQAEAQFTASLLAVEGLLGDSESSLLYKDETGARKSLATARQKLAALPQLSAAQEQKVAPLKEKADDLEKKIEKINTTETTLLGTLSAAERIIRLPNRLATETNGSIVSYNLDTHTVEDGSLKSPNHIALSTYLSASLAATYDGQGLSVWNFAKGTVSPAFFQFVPKADQVAGLAYYPTNKRIYLIDKAKSQILNFAVSETGISKAIVWNKEPLGLADALDLAIDGNIYVLNKTGVSKFTQGRPAEFSFPALSQSLSGAGKIFTTKDAKYIYVLDSGNNRVIVIDKKGALMQIITSPQLNNPQDFSVDEPGHILYFLSNGNLLKASF